MSVRLAYWFLIVFTNAILGPWRHDKRCADCAARLARAEAEARQMRNVIALSCYARRRAT